MDDKTRARNYYAAAVLLFQDPSKDNCEIAIELLEKTFKLCSGLDCTATGNSDHSLNPECGIRPLYLKGASDGDTRKFDIFVHLRYTYERMHHTR